MTTAPASTIPWIELAADISGVCRVAGTLLITSKPTHRLSTKMMKSVRSMDRPPESLRRWRGERRMHDFAVVGDHDPGDQFVRQVDGELAVLDHVEQQRADVACVHRRSGSGHRGGQVVGPDDRDAVLRDGCLAGDGALNIAAERT